MKFNIYDHMMMNIQSVSVKVKPGFIDYFNSEFGISDVHIHASNVYLFTIPVQGEVTSLNETQRKFIFEKELSLYETQYELSVNYQPPLFDRFFEIAWHGVVYHAEIKSL